MTRDFQVFYDFAVRPEKYLAPYAARLFPEKPSHSHLVNKKLKLTLGQQKIHTQPNQKKLFALKKLKATFLYLAHIRTLVSDVSKNVHLRKWMYICKYKFLYISYIKFF